MRVDREEKKEALIVTKRETKVDMIFREEVDMVIKTVKKEYLANFEK